MYQKYPHPLAETHKGNDSGLDAQTNFPRLFKRGLSRRRFLTTAVGATGALFASGLWTPAIAGPGSGDPNPIPHLTPTPFGGFHFFFPDPVEGVDANHGHDPSTITDFNGFIGQAELFLTGTGTDTNTGATAPYKFHTDMRFMKGEFVGTDGRKHHGAFAFI